MTTTATTTGTATTTATRPTRSATHPALGAAMVITAATLWAFNGTVSKLLIQGGFDPPQLTTFRATGAALGLLLFILVTKGPRPLAATPREIPRLAVYGLIGIFSVPLLYFVAISRLPVGIGLLFEFTAPVFVALWVRFGERRPVRRRLWLGLALAVAGLVGVAQLWTVLEAGRHLRLDGLGILAGLSSAVLLATWYVLGSRYVAGPPTASNPATSNPATSNPASSNPTAASNPAAASPSPAAAPTGRPVTVRDPLTLTCWAFVVAAVAGAVVRPWWNFDWGLLAGRSGGQPMGLLAAYFIVFGSITPFLLLTYAMRHLPPTSVGIISMTEVVLASGFAWLLLAETLGTAQIIGGLILVVGVALAESARVTGPSTAGPQAGTKAATRPGGPTETATRPGGMTERTDQPTAIG